MAEIEPAIVCADASGTTQSAIDANSRSASVNA
jgi:hypothetical protein